MKGLTFDNDGDAEKIEGFTAKCDKCGSNNVTFYYEFNYYGGATGYDQHVEIKCRDCENKKYISIV